MHWSQMPKTCQLHSFCWLPALMLSSLCPFLSFTFSHCSLLLLLEHVLIMVWYTVIFWTSHFSDVLHMNWSSYNLLLVLHLFVILFIPLRMISLTRNNFFHHISSSSSIYPYLSSSVIFFYYCLVLPFIKVLFFYTVSVYEFKRQRMSVWCVP